eukprot:IDg3143t1
MGTLVQFGKARQALAYIPAHRRSLSLSISSYAERLSGALAVPGCTRGNVCETLHLRALTFTN